MATSAPTMNPDPRIAAYLQANKQWAASEAFVEPITFVEMQARGRAREGGSLIVVTCSDPRINPNAFFSITSTTPAIIVRTAGGRVAPTMSTLLTLQAVTNNGKKGVIMVVHHTDCGLYSLGSDDEVKRGLMDGLSEHDVEVRKEGLDVLEDMQFGVCKDPNDSVREDVEILRKSPFMKGIQVWGGVLDTATGVIAEVAGVDVE